MTPSPLSETPAEVESAALAKDPSPESHVSTMDRLKNIAKGTGAVTALFLLGVTSEIAMLEATDVSRDHQPNTPIQAIRQKLHEWIGTDHQPQIAEEHENVAGPADRDS